MLHKISTRMIFILLLFAATISSAETVSRSGQVAEVIDVESYTYLRLEEPEVWVATTPLNIAEGDLIKFSGGMEMPNFHSRVLNRTFKSVIFVQNVDLVRKGSNSINSTEKKSKGHSTAIPTNPKQVSIKAPSSGDIVALVEGHTIANIFKMTDSLKTQAVKLRAKVMKANLNIMGKNWITLQDGTGLKPNNKLLVTSAEVVSVGDIVVVSGILKTDIDLGSGYTYKVLLENATFSSEKK